MLAFNYHHHRRRRRQYYYYCSNQGLQCVILLGIQASTEEQQIKTHFLHLKIFQCFYAPPPLSLSLSSPEAWDRLRFLRRLRWFLLQSAVTPPSTRRASLSRRKTERVESEHFKALRSCRSCLVAAGPIRPAWQMEKRFCWILGRPIFINISGSFYLRRQWEAEKGSQQGGWGSKLANKSQRGSLKWEGGGRKKERWPASLSSLHQDKCLHNGSSSSETREYEVFEDV